MQAGRDLPVLQRQGRLDQSGRAGGAVEVADVGLDRPDRAGAPGRGPAAERLDQRGEFGSVAERGPGAVCLNVVHVVGAQAGAGERLGDHTGLAAHAGSGEADFVGPVVAHRPTPDDGVNVVCIVYRVGQPLQHDHGHPTTAWGALGVGVEPAAGR